MIFDNQLRYALQIIESYQGGMPLHAWLKNYFRDHKQMGSKDRKRLAGLVYGFYRLGHGLKQWPVAERLLTGFFLCNDKPSPFLEYFKPAWNDKVHWPLHEKLHLLKDSFNINDIFPWKEALSSGVEYSPYCTSFLIQPDLFVRIRPGKGKEVLRHLTKAGINFRRVKENCLAFDNATKINEFLSLNKEVVIQDYNSQGVAGFFSRLQGGGDRISVWDCCAASGGKSIMIYDQDPSLELTVSDIRESILVNLRKRFEEAGIKNFKSFVTDLSKSSTKLIGGPYDLIIADLPCSGSGTWSRTPEALTFFEEKQIGKYAQLQQQILSTIVPALKKGGKLVYITCSVFKKENEEMVEYISQHFPLQLDQMELLRGYDRKADSMFAASFIS